MPHDRSHRVYLNDARGCRFPVASSPWSLRSDSHDVVCDALAPLGTTLAAPARVAAAPRVSLGVNGVQYGQQVRLDGEVAYASTALGFAGSFFLATSRPDLAPFGGVASVVRLVPISPVSTVTSSLLSLV